MTTPLTTTDNGKLTDDNTTNNDRQRKAYRWQIMTPLTTTDNGKLTDDETTNDDR